MGESVVSSSLLKLVEKETEAREKEAIMMKTKAEPEQVISRYLPDIPISALS